MWKNASSDAAQDMMMAFTKEKEAVKTLTGTITMAGSTFMEKFANALVESFIAKYPGVTAALEFTDSSASIESVLAIQLYLNMSKAQYDMAFGIIG